MMGHHLRDAPVHVGERAATEPNWRKILSPHLGGSQMHFDRDVEARFAAFRQGEVGQRLRISVWTREPRTAKWRQRLQRHNPRRQRRREVLAEKWSERLILPRLNAGG